MPQAYITSPRRSHELPATTQKRSPKSRRSGRSSRLTSPVPLSPKELADYILERGNNATSPIIAKMVLDQQLDSRALAEFADESDSEDRLTSMSVLRDRTLVDDFLRTTSRLRHQLPSMDVVSSARPSLMEIATRLDNVEFSAVSPSSSAPAFQTPQLSPFIPEWDLEDPDTPEELEIFAPRQGTVDDSDDDSLRSPILRNFRVSEATPLEDSRGMHSSLLRPVPPFTPETMPLLSALDMRHTPYGISPSSSQGGDVGLGDHPANAQGGLPNRQISPGDVRGGEHQARITECNEVLPAPRVSRTSSRQSIFENTAVCVHSPRSSSCPPRAVRPHIIIPDTFWPPPPALQRQYVDAEIQTEEPISLIQPLSATIEIVSDAEDSAFFDAKDSHSATESVRDTDEEDDNLFVASQVGEEEHASTRETPRATTYNLPTDTPTSRVVTPMVSAPALPSVVIPAVQRLKSEHGKFGPSTAAPPLARTSSEPSRVTRMKGPSLPSINTKLASSSSGSRPQAPNSAPPRPAPSDKLQSLTKSVQNPKPKAKKEAEAKAKEAEAKAKEAEAKAKEAEAKAKKVTEAKAKKVAEARAKEAEAKAKKEVEAKAKAEADAKAKEEAEAKARAQKVADVEAQAKATRISALKIQPAPSLAPERQPSETFAASGVALVNEGKGVAEKHTVGKKRKTQDSTASDRVSGTQAEGVAGSGEPTGSTGSIEPTEPIAPITSVDTIVADPLKNEPTNVAADVEPPEPAATKTLEESGSSAQQDADSGIVAADRTPPQSIVLTAPEESSSSTRQDTDTGSGDAEGTGAITIDRDPEANNEATSRPTVTETPVIVVTSADSGETMSIDELNSGGQGLLESAWSSSVLPDSINSEGLSSAESKKERRQSEVSSLTVEEGATPDEPPLTTTGTPNPNPSPSPSPTLTRPLVPSPTSAPAQSTENSSEVANPSSGDTNVENTVSSTSSNITPTPVDSSTSESAEDYVHIRSSNATEPFYLVDRSEAIRIDGQGDADIDIGNPWSDGQEGEAPPANPPKRDSQVKTQVQSESNGVNGGQQEESTNPEPAKSVEIEDQAESKKPQVRRDSAVTDVQTENVESTQESSADPGTPASYDTTQGQQVIKLVDSRGDSHPMIPAVAHVLAAGKLDSQISQDSQSEDGEISAVDAGGDGNTMVGQGKSKGQKKKEREKLKKQMEAKLKAEEEARLKATKAQVKSATDESVHSTLANPKGAGGVRKSQGQDPPKSNQDFTAVKKSDAEEAARKKEEDELKNKKEQEGLAKKEEAKRRAAAEEGEERMIAEAVTRGPPEQRATWPRETDAEQRVRETYERDRKAIQRPRIETRLQGLPLAKRTIPDLEQGRTMPSPVPSPGHSTKRAPDIENQQREMVAPHPSPRRADSPSSTHSRSSRVIDSFRNLFS